MRSYNSVRATGNADEINRKKEAEAGRGSWWGRGRERVRRNGCGKWTDYVNKIIKKRQLINREREEGVRGKLKKRKDRHRVKEFGKKRGTVDKWLKKRYHVEQKEKMTTEKK
jgi:hypothetical protein